MPSEFDMKPEDLQKLQKEEDELLEVAKQEDQEKFNQDHRRVPEHVAGFANQGEQENLKQNIEASESPTKLGETGRKSMQGPELAHIDPQTQDMRYEIYQIVNKPPEEQAKAWRDFTSGLKGKDKEFVRNNFVSGGEQMTFIDPVDGTRHVISSKLSD
jgi:hypothetical protein